MQRVEVRYMALTSARSFRVWLVHAWMANTPAAGPMIGMRLFGWGATFYPWRLHGVAPRRK